MIADIKGESFANEKFILFPNFVLNYFYLLLCVVSVKKQVTVR